MLENPRIWPALWALALASCAAPEPTIEVPPTPATRQAEQPPSPADAQREVARLEEAKALLAQAETDVQRARAKRALWQKAWEDLVASRQAVASGDAPRAIRHARSASELARLGLEQLAYPAIK